MRNGASWCAVQAQPHAKRDLRSACSCSSVRCAVQASSGIASMQLQQQAVGSSRISAAAAAAHCENIQRAVTIVPVLLPPPGAPVGCGWIGVAGVARVRASIGAGVVARVGAGVVVGRGVVGVGRGRGPAQLAAGVKGDKGGVCARENTCRRWGCREAWVGLVGRPTPAALTLAATQSTLPWHHSQPHSSPIPPHPTPPLSTRLSSFEQVASASEEECTVATTASSSLQGRSASSRPATSTQMLGSGEVTNSRVGQVRLKAASRLLTTPQVHAAACAPLCNKAVLRPTAL